jgi:hypothetical protein
MKTAVIAGALLGLAILNRPQVLGLAPLLALWTCRSPRTWKTGAVMYAVMMLAATVLVSPWIIRDRIVGGRWMAVSAQSGLVLLQGNNPYAGTALTQLESGANGWHNDRRWSDGLGDDSPANRDRRALGVAFAFITDHPALFLSYAARRGRIFFSAYNHPVHRVTWYALASLACLGLYLARSRWRDLLPVYLIMGETLMVAVVFTAMPRFRAPVEPFIVLFAAVALCAAWERSSSVDRSRSLAA